ncbi:MAG: transporter substrate-binding domain-containing protein [Magnetospirillum sp.]|nr:transporter substrate-binding domain-containing protein [Magnetospirillum sp.]
MRPIIGRFLVLLLCLTGLGAAAEEPAPAKTGEVVTVATRVLPPFVIDDHGKVSGFSIELWERIAQRIDVKTEYTVHATLPELLDAVKNGPAKVGIAAISITAQREALFDFSQPMYDSGLAILVPEGGSTSSLLDVVMMWSTQLLPALLMGALLIAIPAHLVWFLERRAGSDIPMTETYYPGIFQVVYWVATLMGGQAENFPKRPISKVIAVAWIYVGLTFVAYFTAFATSALTVQQLKSGISDPSDLAGKVVSSVEGSTASRYLASIRAEVVNFPTALEAMQAVEKHKVAAAVYDAPVLRHFASHEGRGKVRLAGPMFRQEKYGILFPQGSTLRKRVNEELLRLREDGTYQELQQRWFGAEESS